MIDPLHEPLFNLKAAGSHQMFRRANGRPTAYCTVLNWVNVGIRGVKLEHVELPSGFHTSEAAMLRFVERLTRAGNGQSVPVIAPASPQRRKQLDHAHKVLEAAGLT